MNDENSVTAYDAIPYTSSPYSESTPANCHTIARLFKLSPPDFHSATMLELGCASGGNSIPLAYCYPDAEFVGIDLSGKQIETGQTQVKELQLTNIELKKMSILDADRSLGQFDYIICHGVFSWVDSTVQEKILALCNELLSPNGIAYISYNTLPGWNTVRSIRDMMKYHTNDISDPQSKAQQARAVLDFVLAGLKGDSSSYANFLREEAKLLSQVRDNYLLHDHLEVENNPVYFYEFINMANRHNLQYLADTSVSSMFTGNLPKETADKLQGLSSLINIEQYMDFIRNRRFRRTLLCRKEQQIQRNIESSDIENFYLSTPLQPTEAITEQQISSQDAIQFSFGGLDFKLEEPLAKQALAHLLEQQSKPLHFNDLCRFLQQKSQLDLAVIKDYLFNKVYLTRLLFAGAINIHSDAGRATTTVADAPIISGLAKVQAAAGNTVTNLRHQSVTVQDPDRLVLQHADGSRSQQELATLLAARIEKGEFKLALNDKEIVDQSSIQEQCQLYVAHLMQRFATNGLLMDQS